VCSVSVKEEDVAKRREAIAEKRRRKQAERNAADEIPASPDGENAAENGTTNGVSKSPRPERTPEEQELQYSQDDAVDIQELLKKGFGQKNFQDGLKRIQSKYPERRTKGHRDMPAYFGAFENLTLAVFSSVLPKLPGKLEASWDGVRELNWRMEDALQHPKIQKTQEEINVLMGLPRNAIFQPPKREEELFVFHPECDAPVPSFTRPTVVDEDGDEGHEFFVEDPETGDLVTHGPTALEDGKDGDSGCWYVVLHKPAVVLRAKASVKAEMVGRKKTGKSMRVQKVVDGRWVQLHSEELPRLGVTEAWAPIDGAEMGLPGQPLLQKM
jgi:hypothetical protein